MDVIIYSPLVSPGEMETNDMAEALILLVAERRRLRKHIRRCAADVAKRCLGVLIDRRLTASQHLHVDGESERQAEAGWRGGGSRCF